MGREGGLFRCGAENAFDRYGAVYRRLATVNLTLPAHGRDLF
jgi:hypothetical protein